MTPPAFDTEPTDHKLRLHIEAVERLLAEKKAIQDDITERFALMKAEGYNPKTVRQIVKLRAMEAEERALMQAEIETYSAAMGLA